jgi:hypothetical protein
VICSRIGTIVTLQFFAKAGYNGLRRAANAAISLCARATVIPGFNRPIIVSQCALRWFTSLGAMAVGITKLAVSHNKKRGGRTPITV